jgi:nucleotide-binding universal stress UspA family protein
MFKHILIATDGSELAQKAEAAGLTLAKELKAKVTALTVTEPWDALSMAALADRGVPNPVADYDEAVAASANRSSGESRRPPRRSAPPARRSMPGASTRPKVSLRRPRREAAI